MFSNTSEQFKARFLKRNGDLDSEYRDVTFNFSVLKETKTKVQDTFTFKRESYLWNQELVVLHDKKLRPILRYYVGNMNPIDDRKPETPKVNNIEQNSELWHKTFNRGEMTSVIKASQNEVKQWDWKTLLIGALMGGAIGAMVMTFVYPDIFKGVTPTVGVIKMALGLI